MDSDDIKKIQGLVPELGLVEAVGFCRPLGALLEALPGLEELVQLDDGAVHLSGEDPNTPGR